MISLTFLTFDIRHSYCFGPPYSESARVYATTVQEHKFTCLPTNLFYPFTADPVKTLHFAILV